MELREKAKISLLFDFYAPMLTSRQAEIMQFYYGDDLSLQEIAENTGLSRQGVRDALTKSEKILLDCEEKLGLYEKYRKLCDDLDYIIERLQQIDQNETINDIIQRARSMTL